MPTKFTLLFSIFVFGSRTAHSLTNFVNHVVHTGQARLLVPLNGIAFPETRQKRDADTKSAEDGGAHCLVRCLKPMISMAPQDAGNETLICPRYDSVRIDELCDGYLKARRCLDDCPASPLKNLSTSGFKPLQFMCVDRIEDFKKYMPCLTNNCDRVQKQCEPTCGSLDESVRRLARIQQQVRGPGSRTRGADLDVAEIVQTVADNCQLVGCVGNCSQEPLTRKCGAAAFDLQRDTIWTMLSSMAQAMTSIGLNSVWPPQCQALIAADQSRHPKNGNTGKNQGPNHTDRFAEKQTDQIANDAPAQTTASRNGRVGKTVTSTAASHPTTSSANSIRTSLAATFLWSIFFFKYLNVRRCEN